MNVYIHRCAFFTKSRVHKVQYYLKNKSFKKYLKKYLLTYFTKFYMIRKLVRINNEFVCE